MNEIIGFITNNIYIIGIFVFVCIFLSIVGYSYELKKNTKKLKETQIPRRFKYLDTFFFSYYNGENTNTIAINILMESGSKKTYAMIVNQFEHCYFVDGKEPRLVTGKKGFTFKMPKVEFNQEGNFWIEKEYESFISKEDGIIVLNYGFPFLKRTFKLAYNNIDKKTGCIELENLNKSYDVSLFENATFITGVAEFDDIYNN